MSFSIQTNVNALVAQENLRVNSEFQSRTIQRLTSGYRINSSKDDAAGLAVANQFRSNTMELTQGVRNANDGISQLQIVDGGLNNISNILDRLKTLATQSASSTFTGDRATLNNEYQALLKEIDRQADNVGLGANNTANSKMIGVYIGGGQDANTNSSVNVDLANAAVGSVGLGLSSTSVLTNAAVTVGAAPAQQIAAGESAIFTLATSSGTRNITIVGNAGDTLPGQVSELNTQLQSFGISASLNLAGNLQFVSSNAFSVSGISSGAQNLVAASGGTPDATNNLGLNNLSVAPSAAGNLKITVGGTTVTAAISGATPTQTDVNAVNAALKAQGITSVSAVLDEQNANAINIQGSAAFTATDDFASSGNFVSAGVATAMQSGGNPQIAIDSIAAAVKGLGIIQGKVGTGQNSLNYAINLAQSQISNFSAAESSIRDADVAAEAANLTKAQVLQQASIAAMAQANSAPQAVLKLLQ